MTFSRQVRHEYILVSIVVEIARVHTHARFGLAELAQRGAGDEPHVLEGAVTLIDPELIFLTVVGQVQVDPPVTVEVRGRHAERRSKLGRESRCYRDICKRPIAVLAAPPALLTDVG